MIIYVPLEVIKDNPFQARTEYGDIGELAEDIKRHRPTRPDTYGLQQVPGGRVLMNGLVLDETEVVRLLGPEKRLRLQAGRGVVELEFGHRRYRAFCHLHDQGAAGFEDGYMPVFIRKLSDAMMLDGVWSENRARRDLSAVEEAELLARKLATCASQREVADAWGLDRSTVANRLRLLKLPAEVQQAIRERQISERQALALLGVLQLEQALDGRKKLKWSQEVNSWGSVSPQHYLKHVLEHPETTSNAIRDYIRTTTQRVGEDLPAGIAQHDCTPAPVALTEQMRPDQVQGCAGCPHRLNNHCLLPTCLDAKKMAFAQAQAQAAADALGLSASDDPADFDPRFALTCQHIHQAGGCEHLVAGWVIDNNAYRPNKGDDYINKTGFVNHVAAYARPETAIAIGHRGHITTACQSLAETAAAKSGTMLADLPPHQDLLASPEQQEKWHISAETQQKTLYSRLVSALAGQLIHMPADELALLTYLANPDWTRLEPAVQTHKVAETMLEKGRAMVGYEDKSNAISLHQAGQRILTGAGLDPQWMDPADDVKAHQEAAIRALGLWYNARSIGIRHWLGRPARLAAAEIKRLCEEDLVVGEQLSNELDVAWMDVQWALQKWHPGALSQLLSGQPITAD